jgi:transcriptional regulator with PAS, ATPase and Fis domain
VLITGESGTGKELVARAVHARSERRGQPFVAVNVAAIPETLVESELFGHEKGAFTGAHAKKLGRFELAHGGTVFLDEIGTLRMDLQAKLLRVLQEREIERVGGTRAIKIDVRIIAATNADVPAAVSRGTFREDLYYRLNVVHIGVPPLRNRVDDIPLLVDHFVQRYVQESGKRIEGLTPETLGLLRGYRWPGNVRELQNVIERAVVLTDGPTIGVDDLPLELSLGVAHVLPEETLPLNEASDRFEQQMVLRALDRVHGNVSEAARMLGLHRNSLKAKLARWKIRARDLRSDAQ